MLLDLTSDYMRFLNTETLKDKREKFAQMNEAMAAAGKDKRNKVLKAVFQESFIQLLEIMIASEFDDKKFEKLYLQRYKELFKDQTQQTLWTKILLALDLDELQTWTREVIEKRAVIYKK